MIISLHERMLPTSAGVEPATFWSPVGRRIQLSHQGRHLYGDILRYILLQLRQYLSIYSANENKNINVCKLNQIHCRNTVMIKSLRKHAYSNILKILPPEKENFQIKNSDIFHISAQNIDCGYSLEPPRRSGSNEYPQSMFLSRNKKSNVYPCKPQFYYIKVGFKGVKII